MNSSVREKLLHEIHNHPAPTTMTTKIIAIDGGGGAGKSTLAVQLSEWLGGVPIIHADDFMSGPDSAPDWWQRLLAQVLVPLSRNEPAHYQRFDWDADQLAEWHDIEPGAIIILEGVTSLRQEFRPYLTYSIWLDTPAAERLRRGLERDGQDSLEQWQEWMRWDEDYFQNHRPDQAASLVIKAD